MTTITKEQISEALVLIKSAFGPLATAVRYELQDGGESALFMVDLTRAISADEEKAFRDKAKAVLQIIPFNRRTLSPMVVGMVQGSDRYSFT